MKWLLLVEVVSSGGSSDVTSSDGLQPTKTKDHKLQQIPCVLVLLDGLTDFLNRLLCARPVPRTEQQGE